MVTDGSGRGVADVVISAVSQSLTGAANVSFGGVAQSDASGSYRMTVLSGTNYIMTFVPQPPAP